MDVGWLHGRLRQEGTLSMVRKSPEHTSTAFVGYSKDSVCHCSGSHRSVEEGEVIKVEVWVMATTAGSQMGKT